MNSVFIRLVDCKYIYLLVSSGPLNYSSSGIFVSSVSQDEEMVREYIRNQEQNDIHRNQLALGVQRLGRNLIRSRLCQEQLN